MAYVDGDGRVVNARPWSVRRLVGLFWALVNFFWMFIKTMMGQNVNRQGSSYSRDYRGGGGPPRPPTRRMGGINTLADCNVPGGG